MNETQINLKIINRSELIPADKLHAIMDECSQLARILNSSIQTAIRNQ